MKLKIILLVGIFLLSFFIVYAADFTPQGNIELRDVYGIYNATNVTSNYYFGDGSYLTGIAGNKSWNQSTADDLYVDTSGDTMSGNLSLGLNTLTAGYIKAIGSFKGSALYNDDGGIFTVGITGEDGYSELQFFDWDFSQAFRANKDGYFDLGSNVSRWKNLYIANNISGDSLNVSQGNFENVTSNYYFGDGSYLTGISFTDTNETLRFKNLVADTCAGSTKMVGVLSNGTIQCGSVEGGGDFSFSDFQGSFNSNWTQKYNLYNSGWLSTYNSTYNNLKTENSSWNQSYANNLYRANSWDNFTGIPINTPSNGDNTHLSTADQIYDWVISLSYVANAITSLAQDSSPQLGGYLDTAGYSLGSTSDEIENIYIATNSRIYFGNSQDSYIYFNGSDLITEVN